MKTKIRATILTGFILCMLLTALRSQSKYEYAVIEYQPGLKNIEVSLNGTEFKKISVSKSDLGVNPAIKEVNKMSADGWELFNTTNASVTINVYLVYIFYLRRKIE